jgi:hypothetical protein
MGEGGESGRMNENERKSQGKEGMEGSKCRRGEDEEMIRVDGGVVELGAVVEEEKEKKSS